MMWFGRIGASIYRDFPVFLSYMTNAMYRNANPTANPAVTSERKCAPARTLENIISDVQQRMPDRKSVV